MTVLSQQIFSHSVSSAMLYTHSPVIIHDLQIPLHTYLVSPLSMRFNTCSAIHSSAATFTRRAVHFLRLLSTNGHIITHITKVLSFVSGMVLHKPLQRHSTHAEHHTHINKYCHINNPKQPNKGEVLFIVEWEVMDMLSVMNMFVLIIPPCSSVQRLEAQEGAVSWRHQYA